MNRDDQTPAAGLGKLGLGFSSDYVPLTAAGHIGKLDASWNELQQEWKQVQQTVNERLDATWRDLKAPIGDCVDCLQGDLDSKLDQLKAMRDSVAQAIGQRLDGRMGVLAGQLVSVFNELNPPPAEAERSSGPIEAPDVRTLTREGEPEIVLDYSNAAPPVESQVQSAANITDPDTFKPIQWPGGVPGVILNPGGPTPGSGGIGGGGGGGGGFTVAGQGLGCNVAGPDGTLPDFGYEWFVSIPSYQNSITGVWSLPLFGQRPCITDAGGGTGGGGTGGGGGGGGDTIGPGGGGGGDDTIGGGDQCPAVKECTLPEGAWWKDANDHTQGYWKPGDGDGKINLVVPPECVKQKTCPQCSPKEIEWTGSVSNDETRLSQQLACDPADESGYAERFNSATDMADGLGAFVGGGFQDAGKRFYEEAKNGSYIGAALVWVLVIIMGGVSAIMLALSKLGAKIFNPPAGCDRDKFEKIQTMDHYFSNMQRYGLMISNQAKAALMQASNFACQWIIPTSDQLDLMRLRKKISEKEWTFGQKLLGYCLPWKRKLYEAETEYVEGPQDLIRFMMRDVFDPKSVEKLGLSEDFPEKFTPEANAIAEKIGLSRETALRFWQAHWQMLAPGQIYEMMHRLAPDQNAKDANGDPVSFTPQDAIALLKIADLPPNQIQNLMAISYKPLAKRDARFLWATEVLDDDGLEKLFRQQGFSPENAKILREGAVKAWSPDKAKYAGNLSLAELNKLFQSGTISELEYMQYISSAGYLTGKTSEYVNQQKQLRKMNDLKSVTSRLRTAFISGRIDENQYELELQSAGINGERAQEIRIRDASIKRNSNKQIAIAKLCKLVGQGYMSLDEYMRRARNLGFNELDAALMAQSCNDDIMKERLAKQQQEQRRALQEAEKAQRKAKQLEREARKEARERFPCKEKPKPVCPVGVSPPAG